MRTDQDNAKGGRRCLFSSGRGKPTSHYLMKSKRREATARILIRDTAQITGPCDCLLLSAHNPQEKGQDDSAFVPIPSALRDQLVELLALVLPAAYPLSILLLHLVQLEQTHIPLGIAALHKRQHYHAPGGLLDQVLTNARRVIRASDQIIIHPEVASALIFPYVDYQGAISILERVYHSISFLQAETVVPPLHRETVVQLGVGTYPPQSVAGEELLADASRATRQFTLRPMWHVQPWEEQMKKQHKTALYVVEPGKLPEPHHRPTMEITNAPFMHLPPTLPGRLKHVIPYPLARKLRCAPVGRNQNSLTVAMANPLDTDARDRLAEITGMTIFPVACEEEALDFLLSNEW
jgi:hypothetical protein